MVENNLYLIDKTCILKLILELSSLLLIFYDCFSQDDFIFVDVSKIGCLSSPENNSNS